MVTSSVKKIEIKSDEIPNAFMGKTFLQIIGVMRQKYNADPETNEPLNEETKFFQEIGKKVFNPVHWKRPTYVICYGAAREIVKSVLTWHHGMLPIETPSGVTSYYSC